MVEMCVGVATSCMPSISKVSRYHFPGFSPVDALLAFKPFSYLISARSQTSSTPYDNTSHSRFSGAKRSTFQSEFTSSESNENLKSTSTTDVELADVPSSTVTRYDTGLKEKDGLMEPYTWRDWH